ncbi:SMI1/KNR4 family protein [Hymenobacter jeollabukensis]|uniref:SMI1/KNR4 family protein n=1 Tax=Hymenobacter jeollabukensis TaxID=2025313 RepID=A0A5R8WUB4_9BACT|nr:SMI1/KNR4 family protein [Hymenobacter jeollabukensis]TLM95358.1 SMI1/KNR4 family protein [Hymenobacter jeollabukensis]
MTPDDISIVHQFVDDALDSWHGAGVMNVPYPDMPTEMRDEAGVVHDSDAVSWKPIPSTAADSDIKELEDRINLRYPDLYKEFLQYKHFYDLWSQKEINFFSHGIYDWKEELFDRYFNSWDPAKLIGQGYIYFADYSDWGMVCFDTNNQNQEDGDCPIIMIDHDLLYDEPLPMETLYPSFADMMRSLREEQINPTQYED